MTSWIEGRRLERDASGAGGRVHALLGNHEAMRLMADMWYVAPGEYAAFVDGQSAELRKNFIENAPKEDRERLEKELVPGMIEMIRAFGPKGEYGMRLRSQNAVVRINGIVFLHGGISPAVSTMTCGVINETIRRELSIDMDKTREAPLTSLTAREDGPRRQMTASPIPTDSGARLTRAESWTASSSSRTGRSFTRTE